MLPRRSFPNFCHWEQKEPFLFPFAKNRRTGNALTERNAASLFLMRPEAIQSVSGAGSRKNCGQDVGAPVLPTLRGKVKSFLWKSVEESVPGFAGLRTKTGCEISLWNWNFKWNLLVNWQSIVILVSVDNSGYCIFLGSVLRFLLLKFMWNSKTPDWNENESFFISFQCPIGNLEGTYLFLHFAP